MAAGAEGAPFDHTYAAFDRALHAHVRDGRVDYRSLQADRAALDSHLKLIGEVDAAMLARFSRDQQIAYWVNAYNAFVLVAVIDRYPLRRRGITGLAYPANSIWQIPGIWTKLRWRAGGRDVTLDDIEHRVLRVRFQEPRVHFALVCASVSCPDLRWEAYRADRLQEQLDDQARRFLHDTTKGMRLDRDAGAVRISSIFKWFGDDFLHTPMQRALLRERIGSREAGVLTFIARYQDDAAVRELLTSGALRLDYLSYDWSLNET